MFPGNDDVGEDKSSKSDEGEVDMFGCCGEVSWGDVNNGGFAAFTKPCELTASSLRYNCSRCNAISSRSIRICS